MVVTRGLKAPAATLVGPATSAGAKGSEVGQAPPAPSQLTGNRPCAMTSGVMGELHGVRSASAVAAPHCRGLASGARSPPFRRTTTSLTGSCGFSVNRAVSLPVAGFAETLPASFTTTPEPSASR